MIVFLLIRFGTSAAFAQESGSSRAVGPGPEVALTGEIRWKKALGTVPYTTGISDAHSDPCSAFHVLVVTANSDQTLIKYQDDLAWKQKDGDLNVCKFSLTIPSNIAIRVYPEMGKKNPSSEQREQLYLRKGWAAGEKIPNDGHYGWIDKTMNVYPGNLLDPQPKTGYKRGFAPGYRELILARSTFLAFEMVYIDNRFGGYPKYTEPPPPPPKTPYITSSQVIFTDAFRMNGFVVLTWDAGTDHPNAEVVFSLNNSPKIPLVKQAKGGRQINVERGRLYTYFLTDGGKTLSTASFVVQ